MLDISIKDIRKVLTTKIKQQQFLEKNIIITEKYDGIKLTLIRNENQYNQNDYDDNWIVSYKGNILHKEESQGINSLNENTIEKESMGVSQFLFIHNHLKINHQFYEAIPINTEFFIEFIQNKPTITRDYHKFHDMFLIGYSHCEYIINDQQVISITSNLETKKNDKFANILRIKQPKILFQGKAKEIGNFDNLIKRYSNFESELGGKAEGVIIKIVDDNELYKIVSQDQYDKDVRKLKKQRWIQDEESEKLYWESLQNKAKEILNSKIDCNYSLRQKLLTLSKLVYSMNECEFNVKNCKKKLINYQDDLFLTTKFRLDRMKKINDFDQIGIFVMSGKPVHNGHWKMIEFISTRVKRLFLYVSLNDRDNISGNHMLTIWKKFLIENLPENVRIKFTNNPYVDCVNEIKAFDNEKNNFVIFSDDEDKQMYWHTTRLTKFFPNLIAQNRITNLGIDRNQFDNVSGAEMRFNLKYDKNKFIEKLPYFLSYANKNFILNLLSEH